MTRVNETRMRKGGVVLFSLCILLVPLGLQAGIIWEDDFESYTLGQNLHDAGGWVRGSVHIKDSIVQDAGDPVNPSQVWWLEEIGGNRIYRNELESPVSGNVGISWDVLNTGGEHNMTFWLYGGGEEDEGGTFRDGTLRLRFSTFDTGKGGINVSGNRLDVESTTIEDVYEADTWYRVFFDLALSASDPDASTYTLQIFELQEAAQGTLGTRVAFIEDAGVGGMDEFWQFGIFGNNTNTQSLKVDNITVIPEPAVAGLLLSGLVLAWAAGRRRVGRAEMPR